jgi:hypothetical protein
VSTITLSIIKIGDYWTALFERITAEGYAVARATISTSEPSNDRVDRFLMSLDHSRLQFTEPVEPPATTQTVFVEKKLKYEKDRYEEVELANKHGVAKQLLHTQKRENNEEKRLREKQEEKEREAYIFTLKQDKRTEKSKGR